ncbi:MAG: DUF1499 domain-containing protein [Gemmatimonadota bacterium]|nr:MAG: DUF1499 domain-containing protein [Gemmatimonadota bacterium]
MSLNGLWKLVTENTAQTSEDSADHRLRGRTYLVAYATVWDEIIAMIESRPLWKLLHADEASGSIHAEARTLVFRFVDDVRIKLKLDRDALTRVDMWSGSRVGNADLGANRRRIARFFKDLDRRLQARR